MKAHTRYQIILLGDRGTIGVNNLPRVVVWQCTGQESNPRPSDHKSDALAITLPSHIATLQDIVLTMFRDAHTDARLFLLFRAADKSPHVEDISNFYPVMQQK